MKKWEGDNATMLKGLDKLITKMEKMHDSFIASAAKQREKLAAKLGDYATEDDIQTAYGYAYITEAERKALLRLLEESQETLTADDAAAHSTWSILKDLKEERQGFAEVAGLKKVKGVNA